MPQNWFIIAFAGATCSGKTTLAKKIKDIFPNSVLLHQDDHFFDVPKRIPLPELNHWNFEVIESLDNDEFLNQIHSVLNSPADLGFTPDEFYAKFSKYIPDGCKQLTMIPNILILDGFLLLNEPRIVGLSNVRFFMTLDRQECFNRRSVRTYDPPDVPGYFDDCVWPWFEHHKKEIDDKVDGVVYFSGTEKPDDLLDKAMNVIIEKIVQ